MSARPKTKACPSGLSDERPDGASRPVSGERGGILRRRAGAWVLLFGAAVSLAAGWSVLAVRGTAKDPHPGHPAPAEAGSPVPAAMSGLSVSDLIALEDGALERLDPAEVDLAVARSLPGHASLDVERYRQTLDQWAGQVRSETDRHLYKFHEAPGDYRNSLAYFQALALATVVGQDLGVGYDRESVSFDDPQDLFIHGVIDRRRGTCVSLPVLYLALGHRLGYPIRAVTVPKHMFCRWQDPATGKAFNIEASGAGGLVSHDDAYYLTWPARVDPQDVSAGGCLKSLTMREFLAHKLASRGDYYWHKGDRPQAQVSYALAHDLYPDSRQIFEILASQVMEESERFPWSRVYHVYQKTKPIW